MEKEQSSKICDEKHEGMGLVRVPKMSRVPLILSWRERTASGRVQIFRPLGLLLTSLYSPICLRYVRLVIVYFWHLVFGFFNTRVREAGQHCTTYERLLTLAA